MMVFDVTLVGYNAETDDTDHLVKWVNAPNEQMVRQWLHDQGLTPFVDSVDHLAHMTDFGDIDSMFETGVDIIINEDGSYLSGVGFSVARWVAESQEAASKQ